MKTIVYLLILSALLYSCKGNTKLSGQHSATTSNVSYNAKALIAEFKPMIQGVWVKAAYIDKVGATKSPLAAVDQALDMTTMYINTHKIMGDSIIVSAGWGNHDGSFLTLLFKPGKRKSTIAFGMGDLGYSIINGDTILTTYWPDEKNKNKIIATNYRRAQRNKEGDDLSSGINYLVNKALIAGSYLYTNENGVTSQVRFSEHGKVNGLSAYKTYVINIDLSEEMNNLDEIGFDIYKEDHRSFSFKFDADTLKLYDTKPNADSTLLILDKLRYKLLKVKK